MRLAENSGLMRAARRGFELDRPSDFDDLLASLDEAERLAVTLVFYEHHTLEETANRLGVPRRKLHAMLDAVLRVLARNEIQHLASWTPAAIDGECGRYHDRYEHRLELQYEHALQAQGVRADRWVVEQLADALPTGDMDLMELLADRKPHRHHLSAKSSQTLALGLVGSAYRSDPTMRAFTEALSPAPALGTDTPQVTFEYEADRSLLGESPYRTTIDLLLEGPDAVYCVEAKWAERGMGTCSCPKPKLGRSCSARIRQRQRYWDTAQDAFGMPPAAPDEPCPLAAGYQAIRNVAAAHALAGADRNAVFVLVYDMSNPYFGGIDWWPGWPDVLDYTLRHNDRVTFKAIAWQDLAPKLPLDEPAREWAAYRHRLEGLGLDLDPARELEGDVEAWLRGGGER